VIRPLATSIPNTTWHNWRKVAFSYRGAVVCKSAKISVIGFCREFCSWELLRYYEKPNFPMLFLVKGMLIANILKMMDIATILKE